MKLTTKLSSDLASSLGVLRQLRQNSRHIGLSALAGGALATVAIATVSPKPAAALPFNEASQIAQALPTPLPPLPASDGSTVPSGEQYLVLVNGNSDLLLQQVRQIEPGAFVNYVGGQSVIQAGRFNSYQNAQARVNELANFGIGAKVQATDFAGAPIAVTPPTDYDLSFPPPGPVSAPTAQASPPAIAATPSSIEFGQAAPFQPSVPSTTTPLPPSGPTAPPSANVAPPPLTNAVVADQSVRSGYYVVVPGSASELQSIVNRVVALGAPTSLVSTRSAPRGPHVAVGPYDDFGIAQEWTNFLRNSGLVGARVHFE